MAHRHPVFSRARSTFLTGRGQRVNRFACVTEAANGFPGAAARAAGTVRDGGTGSAVNGYSTFWLGKNHNVPEDLCGGVAGGVAAAKGFDRFYGFIGGETNQWFPAGVEDNRFIGQPYQPEQGYHLSKDLADQAIPRSIKDHEVGQPVQALVHVVVPGCRTSCAASCSASTSTSTRARSMTGYELQSGCCPG